ncbi:MAG: peptidase [Planctomycetota bacterium]|nr:MAG: peptidase [Planctomycetota bacterium]
MRTFHLSCAALALSAAISCAQGPPPPPGPAVVIDKGTFDVFQGMSRRAVESFTITRAGNGDVEIQGVATLALPDGRDGSEVWTFYPVATYGQRGLKSYDLRAKFPTGPGSTEVKFDGGQCTWTFKGPNNQNLGPIVVPLPINGMVLDKRIMSHFAHIGLVPGIKALQSLDPDTARVAELRISDPVPAKIETPLGSFLCERVLVTTGAFGANLWFDPEGFLLRVEIPSYGLVAIRRGCYGYPGVRRADVVVNDPATRDIQVMDNRALVSGSLWQPPGQGPFTTVLVIGDSGPQDRNGNPPGAQIFWNHHRDWARAIRSAGVAVITTDDPGTGFSTPGRDDESISDFILHARAVLTWARKQAGLQGGKVGVIGHGEGSLIALQLLANGDADFAVVIGPHGRLFGEIFLQQGKSEWERQGVSAEIVKAKTERDLELQRLWLDKTIEVWKSPPVPKEFENMGYMRSIFRDMMNYDTIQLAAKARGPVLVLHGDADSQIPVSDGEALAKALTDAKKDVTFLKLAGLDHMLMKKINGDVGDSADPDRKVDEAATDFMVKWLKER